MSRSLISFAAATGLVALSAWASVQAQAVDEATPKVANLDKPAETLDAADRRPVEATPPDRSPSSTETGRKAVPDSAAVAPAAPNSAPPVETATPAPSAAPEPSPAATPSAILATPANAPPVVENDPVLTAVIERLKQSRPGGDKADLSAMSDFYGKRTSTLLTAASGWSPVGEAVLAELRRSEDWGLPGSDYGVSQPSSSAPAAMAEAEIALAAAMLRYARHASGGRVDPASLSRINDLKPVYADPSDILAGVASAEKPGAYLLSLHPQHPQYQKLHASLVKLRRGGPEVEPQAAPEPVRARVPGEGPILKVGQKHKDVPLIRARLSVAGETGDDGDETFDSALAAAVKAFQADKGLKQSGAVDKATRAALSGGEPRKKTVDPARKQELIALNMERWRWMPRDLGPLHILNNIPSFTTRFVKNGQIIFQERIVTGKPNTPTPVFSAMMRTVVFNPEWGVPDSIKVKELWPSLRRKAADDFFGTTSDTRILQRYNMRVVRNGQVVDASKIDWSTADPRQYSFIQASGGGNVLGTVKFLFPNKHDVYMHDTSERHLFQQNVRAYSHGCMRVNNPRRLAELIMAEAEAPSWPAEKVASAINSKALQEVKLDKPFPVHSVYLTAWADDATGQVETFNDLYGHDARLVAALAGRPVKLEDIGSQSELASTVRQQIDKRRAQKQDQSDDPFSGFFSGIFAN